MGHVFPFRCFIVFPYKTRHLEANGLCRFHQRRFYWVIRGEPVAFPPFFPNINFSSLIQFCNRIIKLCWQISFIMFLENLLKNEVMLTKKFKFNFFKIFFSGNCFYTQHVLRSVEIIAEEFNGGSNFYCKNDLYSLYL